MIKRCQIAIAILISVILLEVGGGFVWANLTNPYEIYRKHYDAMGGLDRLKAIKTTYSEGTTVYDYLEGTFKLWEETPLRYRLEEDFSVIKLVRGDNGQIAWSRDTNGKVLIERDEETIKRREIKKRLENFEHLVPNSEYFSLSFEGIQKIEALDCYVVKISNSINNDITWNYFETHSFYLKKSVLKMPDIEIHSRYSDYRDVGGIKHSFYEESYILPRDKKEIIRLSRFQINPEINRSVFELPENDIRDFRFLNSNSSKDIPFELIENNIYLKVEINSNSQTWLLDSGSSMSIIDADYAASLGLKSKGKIKGFGFGSNFELSFATLPSYQVKGVQFDQQTIYSFQGLSDNYREPDIVGVLGYDFLSRFVVKIDYTSQRISLYDPSHFHYSGSGAVISAPLKNKTFGVPMTVDEKYSGKWSLDLGAFNVSFHYPFAAKHGLLDRKGVDRISSGLGGDYMEKTIQFKTVNLGGFVLKNTLINVPLRKGTGATVRREVIGNIGNSLLRHYLIYLDYERQQVIVEKGKDFNRIFPRDKSGLIISRSETGMPAIVFVSPGSPAKIAGFKTGDIIVSVNHSSVDSFPGINAIRRLLREKAGSLYKFDVRRDGKLIKIYLTLKDLY